MVARPVRELRAFAKINLEPGATEHVTFALNARDLSYWSTTHGRWQLEEGEFEIAVGASSRDLPLATTVYVPAPAIRVRLDTMATLKEWLADPDGSAALRKAVGVEPDGSPRGILGDPDLMRIIGNFPISTLAAFHGVGISHAIVNEAIDLLNRSSSDSGAE